ncbi:MAG: hypothetical protein ABI758_04590 [Candidatus Woesebacteria bacterium]
MGEFQANYKEWDHHPFDPITRENVMSFIIWSLWDSQGNPGVQYYRLLQLGKLEEISTWLQNDFLILFSFEELQLAANVFNSLKHIDKDDEDENFHDAPMTPDSAAVRIFDVLHDVLLYWHTGIFKEKGPQSFKLRELPGLKRT